MTTHTNSTGSALAIREDQQAFTPQQEAALRHLGAENATAGDLAVFFHQAQRTGLDPFARQVYLVGRDTWDARSRTSVTKYTIQTGIDGFRLVARRAADAAREPFGYEDTLWADAGGRWHDVWLSDAPPAAAKVTVVRNGQRFPAIALFREYAGTKKDGSLTKMWAEKGALMIAKCAEALALRKAFPQDLSGLYTADEMSKADQPAATATVTQTHTPAPSVSLADAIAAESRDWHAEADELADRASLLALYADAHAYGADADALAYIVARGKSLAAAPDADADGVVDAEVLS